MLPIEILPQEAVLEYITFTKEDGLRKSLEMMLMFSTINTEQKRVLKKIKQEENSEKERDKVIQLMLLYH